MKGGYSGTQANKALAGYTHQIERLIKHTNRVDEMIDLDTACRGVEAILTRRMARIIRDEYVLPTDSKTHQLPSPDALVVEVARLREAGEITRAHVLSRMIRDIRAMNALAVRMSRSMVLPKPHVRYQIRFARARFALAA